MRTNAYVMVAGLVAGILTVSGCSAGDDVGSTTSAPTDRAGDDAATDGGTTDEPQRCVRNSDCLDGEQCRLVAAGRKVCMGCREDFDCCVNGTATCGKVCREERCVAGESERCDGVDNDADGETDEDFDLASDAANCGRCGVRCDAVLSHTRPGGTTCEDRVCRLRTDGCADGFFDINGTDADGCEYGCIASNGGVEEPDGDDNNCDGATDEGFACVRGTSRPCGAGTGICSEGTQTCRADGTWSDCTDNVGPRTEICNMLDDDCDGVADNGLSLGAEVCDAELVDEDCDGLRNEGCDCIDGATQTCGSTPALAGVGICRYGTQTCAGGTWGECAGAQAPLTLELCDGLDDDCDGVIPADEVDADRDGYAACADDCDDADRFVNPEMPELCDGVDQDCDGLTDEDPFFAGAPCRGLGACAATIGTIECVDPVTVQCSVDLDGSSFAGGVETSNGLDDDCDGSVDEGFACVAGISRACGLDANPALAGVGICRRGLQTCASDGTWGGCVGAIEPLVAEACNMLDDDCDGIVPAGEIDGDDDRFRVCADDCDDADPMVRPGAAEVCDTVDNDCDGATDEGFFVGVACRGVGACGVGTYECASPTTNRCSTDIGGLAYPNTAETCNMLDDDCDGVPDDGGVCGQCAPGQERPCGTLNVGVCRRGTQTCQADRTWGGCVGLIEPSSEACNGLDDNCDGVIPADEVDADRDGYAACANDCDDANRDANPEASEACNGLDDDCDGSTDEDFSVGVACRGIGACGMGTYECASPTTNRCSTDIGGSAYPTPAPLETCDSVDNDCDGTVDLDADASVVDDDPLNCGACGVECAVPNTVTACVVGACTVTGCATGFLLVDGACLRCDAWPITAEFCDAGFLDEDCDGRRNEDCGCVNGSRQPCGLDLALDGVGVCRFGMQTCAGGAWGMCSGAVTPSSEVCNDRDDDCDDVVPATEVDADNDGLATCEGDCDDTDSAIRPGVAEACDGDDNNCDGTVDEGFFIGVPCVGFGTCAIGERECAPPSATPDATRCSSDLGGSDAPATVPTETCDNLVDDDCDGSVDEGCGECSPGQGRPCGLDPLTLHNVGICRVGVQTCTASRTWGVCAGAVAPWSFEACDKDDNDCDGSTDEGFDLTSDPFNCGSCGRSCYAGGNIASASCVTAGPCPPEGECAEPIPTCAINKCAFGFYDSDGDVTTGCERGCFLTHNGVERCDGLDNDCDGVTDEPPTCAPPPPNAPMTFSVTLPAGFPNDATTMFCATFVIGLWSCGGYPVTETTDPGTGATTYTTSGAAIAGNHEFGLCTARCDMPTGTWVVTEDTNGLLVETATPAVTYDGTARSTNLGRNGQRGGNWVASF